MLENIKYKIIQAPMAGNILTPTMVASVCNNEMLGSIPAGYLTIEALTKFIQETKKLTNEPFIVNFFIEDTRYHPQFFQKNPNIIAIEKLLNIYSNHTFCVPPNISMDAYIDLIIQENVPIVSCTFGFFNIKTITKLKSHGIKIIGTVTTVEEAKYCVSSGADAIVLQGTEAGGHQGGFLTSEPNNTITEELLKQVKQLNLDVILISAGGISINNMSKYFQNGANYVQLGTVFMMAYESLLPLEIKKFIQLNDMTILTKNITGKWARGISNKLVATLNDSETYEFPIQHFATSIIRNEAKQQLNPEYIQLWAGSNKCNYEINHLADIIYQLKSEYEKIPQIPICSKL